MKILQKWWARLLLSFFLGACCAELFHVFGYNLTSTASTIVVWGSAIIFFLLITAMVYSEALKILLFGNKPEKTKKTQDDILDEEL